MAKNAITKVNKVEIKQSLPETISQEDMDIIAACVLSGDDEIIPINPELNQFDVYDTINIKDRAADYGYNVRSLTENVESELEGNISIQYGYADVARKMMVKFPQLHINLSEDCILFRDWRAFKAIVEYRPTLLVGGCIKKSDVSNITFPSYDSSAGNNSFRSRFHEIEYFNEMYYFAGIGGYNFRNANIKEYTFSPKETTTAYHGFENAQSLERVYNFEDNPNITNSSSNTFTSCASLRLNKLPPKLQVIGGYMFYNCSNITISSLPDSVKTIAAYAFYGCTKITISKIPDGVITLGTDTFRGCESIVTLDLNNVQTLNGTGRIFYGCTSLTDLYIYKVCNFNYTAAICNTPNLRVHINSLRDFAVKKDYVFSAANYDLYDINGNKITSLDFDDITVAPTNMVAYWNATEVINIPNVEIIEGSAFQNCTNIVTINSKPLKRIEQRAFYAVSTLVNIDLSKCEFYGGYAFSNCVNLNMSNADFSKVTRFEGSAFYQIYFNNLTEIILSGDVNIGNNVFYRIAGSSIPFSCDHIIVLDNYDKTASIGNDNWRAFTGVRLVDFGESVDTLAMNLFYGVSVRNVVLRCPYVVNRTQPTSSSNRLAFQTAPTYIFVPEELVDEYKSSTSWSSYSGRIHPIRGTQWRTEFGSTNEYADYPDEYKPQPLRSIGITYDAETKSFSVTYNDKGVIEKYQRGYALSVVSPTNQGITIDSNDVINYGVYGGDITVKVTSTYDSSITNTITISV